MNISEELARLAKLRDDGVLTQAEFDQQKATLLAGGAPGPQITVTPAKRPSGIAKGCGIIALVLIALAVLGAIAGGGGKSGAPAKPDQQAAATPATKVTATELFNAYQANEASAQQTYGDQPLLVSGTVDGVDLDFSNKPFVKLRTPNQFMSAQAKLTQASEPKASGLGKGQKVVLLCAEVEEVMSIPMLKDCDIQ